MLSNLKLTGVQKVIGEKLTLAAFFHIRVYRGWILLRQLTFLGDFFVISWTKVLIFGWNQLRNYLEDYI